MLDQRMRRLTELEMLMDMPANKILKKYPSIIFLHNIPNADVVQLLDTFKLQQLEQKLMKTESREGSCSRSGKGSCSRNGEGNSAPSRCNSKPIRLSHECRFRQMQIQTDTDSYSDRCKQVQSTESHKYKDEREQTLAADPDRCIAQNHINTEMNESKTGRHQQRATTDSDRQQTEQQIQTADSDSGRQNQTNEAKPDNIRCRFR
ncbi:hypothetical protein Tco_0782919 [Tanacetum coccineum]